MCNMLAIDGDDDTVLEPVAALVVVEAVNESNNVGICNNPIQQCRKRHDSHGLITE